VLLLHPSIAAAALPSSKMVAEEHEAQLQKGPSYEQSKGTQGVDDEQPGDSSSQGKIAKALYHAKQHHMWETQLQQPSALVHRSTTTCNTCNSATTGMSQHPVLKQL